MIEYFKIDIEMIRIENIPKDGSIILAMNHPLGGMDGVAFISSIQNHRKDIKYIVNDLLMNVENLKDLFVGVNKHGKNSQDTRDNIDDLFASEKAVWMALESIQCLGGNGYINEYPTGRLLRDAKLYDIGAGTNEIRRMLIGREVFKKYN